MIEFIPDKHLRESTKEDAFYSNLEIIKTKNIWAKMTPPQRWQIIRDLNLVKTLGELISFAEPEELSKFELETLTKARLEKIK